MIFSLESNKMTDFVKFEMGNIVMATGGHNAGRVGTIINIEKHAGAETIVHVRDAQGSEFTTRQVNMLVIGKGTKPLVSLPKMKGLRRTIIQEQIAAGLAK